VGLAVDASGVWVTNSGGHVVRVDPKRLAISRRVAVGRSPVGVAIGLGRLWVTNRDDGTLTRIDPRTQKVLGQPIRVGKAPTGVAVGS
jgi:YVTN family beta-propeller protein